ncbi:cyclin [Martiniozyma asiatica (nom. inval.)]|nr:cyclin [Martiniozyma asiatica]
MKFTPTKKAYGPTRRPIFKPYSSKLESMENYKNKIIVNEYMDTIALHLENLESQTSINPTMIDLQPEVKWYMRPYLVNFIIQMHSTLKLKPQTLFLCWSIIDRYCAKRIAFKQHYQLIGCTALWIASKYEDKKSRVPTVGELVAMCSNVYEDSMFREMEIHILSTLNWSVSHTSLEDILQLAVKSSDPDGKEKLNKPLEQYKGNTPTVSAILAVARFLCELSLYERQFLTYSTTLVGTASFLMACSVLNMDFGSEYIIQAYTLFMSTQQGPKLSKTRFDSISYSSNELQLPTPITPQKEMEFYFEEENDESYHSDVENEEPGETKKKILSSNIFFLNFNGIETIEQLRQISLCLMFGMLEPSKTLVEKYEPLGVMTVVKRFISDNDLTDIDLETLKSTIETNPYSADVYELTNALLGFEGSELFYKDEIKSHFGVSRSGYVARSSASISDDSAFESPSNFSSFSSVSSATLYESCAAHYNDKSDFPLAPTAAIMNTPN